MREHFRLPDGPVAIQFSGGRTSGYMLRQILSAYRGRLPADAHVLFQNTGREMPETLDFVHECGSRWGVRITWLEYRDAAPWFVEVSHNSASRNGEPFEALIQGRAYLPNVMQRFCTQELKVRPAKRWMMARGYGRWTAIVGIRADERHRLGGKSAAKERHVCAYPLAAAGVTKRDVAAFWSAQPFDLRLPNIAGKTPLGNCDGCFLKSERTRAWLARYRPDRAQWWAEQEAAVSATARGKAGFFDKRVRWSELIEHARRQPDWVFDVEEGASVYCDVGFGGCHD